MRHTRMLLTVVLAVLATGPLSALAQDASPTAGLCDAPALPPGTPTPMEEMEGPPDGTPADEMTGMEMGTPEAAEAEPAAETAPPDLAGTPVSGAVADEALAGLENLVNCINSGDPLKAAALVTDDLLVADELGTRYDLAAQLEQAQPMELRDVGEVRSYPDGRVSVDLVYAGFFNGPGNLTPDRWFLAEEDGYLKLDGFEPIPMPEGALPGATVVEVRMVDYAFALDAYTIPAGPVIFRTSNDSASGAGHVNVVLTYPEGTTAEQLIEGEVDVMEAGTGFFGALFLEPGESGDLVFERLEPGIYFLGCDVETEDGTPHYELGMIAQITVE